MAGLLGSMFTGNSGLQAASKGVSVVGDNIANTNTVGFKAGRIHFQEMLQEFIDKLLKHLLEVDAPRLEAHSVCVGDVITDYAHSLRSSLQPAIASEH